MLQIHVLPEIGGDTLFANMYRARHAVGAPAADARAAARHESEHLYRGRCADRGMDDVGKAYPEAIHR
jgi:taurine dioxygenase